MNAGASAIPSPRSTLEASRAPSTSPPTQEQPHDSVARSPTSVPQHTHVSIWPVRSFVFAVLLSAFDAHADALLVDRIAAVVDGHPITRSLVTLRAQARMKAAATKDDQAKVFTETLETLIEERLIQEDARRLHLVIASEDIDRALAEIGKQTQLSPDALQAELKRQGLTLTEYRASIGQMLLELKWLNLKLNRTSALDSDRARDLAERSRFLTALRAEFAVEVRQ